MTDREEVRRTHDMEQLAASLREMAPILAEFREALRAHGVPEEEAFALVQIVEERWAEMVFDSHRKLDVARAQADILSELSAALKDLRDG